MEYVIETRNCYSRYGCSVYGLQDPRTGEIRYVGISRQPKARMKEHARDKKNVGKRRWIDDLRRDGLLPEVVILGHTTTINRRAERNWIARMLAAGNRLTNEEGLPAWAS